MQKKTIRVEFTDGKFKSHKDILTMTFSDQLFFQFSDNKGQMWTIPWAVIKEIKVANQKDPEPKKTATKRTERDTGAMAVETPEAQVSEAFNLSGGV